MARVFGAIRGVALHVTFPDREAVAAADVHNPLRAGISGGAKEGADSIVVSGGYDDDEDYGDVIVYTGHGGQDDRGRQIADQTLTAQNLTMSKPWSSEKHGALLWREGPVRRRCRRPRHDHVIRRSRRRTSPCLSHGAAKSMERFCGAKGRCGGVAVGRDTMHARSRHPN
jgi:hypothetical protein